MGGERSYSPIMRRKYLGALGAVMTLPVTAVAVNLGGASALAANPPKNCNPVQAVESKYMPIKSIKPVHMSTGATDCLITLKNGSVAATNMEPGSMSLYNTVKQTSATIFKVVTLHGVGKAAFVAYGHGKPEGADALSNGNVIYALSDNLSVADDTLILKALVKLA